MGTVFGPRFGDSNRPLELEPQTRYLTPAENGFGLGNGRFFRSPTFIIIGAVIEVSFLTVSTIGGGGGAKKPIRMNDSLTISSIIETPN